MKGGRIMANPRKQLSNIKKLTEDFNNVFMSQKKTKPHKKFTLNI